MTMCKEMEELVAIAKAEGRAEGIAEGKAEGIGEGKVEGRAEGKRTIAVNMLKAEKYNTEDIAEILGLTLEEIEELKNNM